MFEHILLEQMQPHLGEGRCRSRQKFDAAVNAAIASEAWRTHARFGVSDHCVPGR